jgi:hypothetical protein
VYAEAGRWGVTDAVRESVKARVETIAIPEGRQIVFEGLRDGYIHLESDDSGWSETVYLRRCDTLTLVRANHGGSAMVTYSTGLCRLLTKENGQ